MPRYWTLEEARSALPEVIPLLQELQAAARQARTTEEPASPRTIPSRPAVNGHGSVAGASPRRFEDVVRRILRRLTEMGIQVKDIDTGLIDFPHPRVRRDGSEEEVLLCFRLGESDIGYWHGLVGGFAGRRPISEL